MNAKNSWIVFLILAVATAGCTLAGQPQSNPATAVVSVKHLDADGSTIFEKSFTVSKGINAFEAIQQNVNIESETFSFGVMIKSINGTAPPDGYYLALYVNGAYAEKGIRDYIIDQDIAIEWKTEKIEPFPPS